MSAWLTAGVYTWWLAQLGADWPVLAAPALVLMALWLLLAAIAWARYALGRGE